ncbi:MAG: PAAR domain-containing protein [Prochloraceae cyanobacterium]
MNKPIARMGDRVAHPPGDVLKGGPASPNVFIGGKPAWRAQIDTHFCPHHSSGKVFLGSKSVFINGHPACRQGNIIQEANAINNIIGGCPTVSVGD